MSEPVHVELPGSCDAAGLVELLTARGLSATVRTEEDHCTLDVRYAADPDVRLRHEVEAALAAWLEERDHPLVPALGPAHQFVLRPPGD
jgi:hypothetical protein